MQLHARGRQSKGEAEAATKITTPSGSQRPNNLIPHLCWEILPLTTSFLIRSLPPPTQEGDEIPAHSPATTRWLVRDQSVRHSSLSLSLAVGSTHQTDLCLFTNLFPRPATLNGRNTPSLQGDLLQIPRPSNSQTLPSKPIHSSCHRGVSPSISLASQHLGPRHHSPQRPSSD
jgi:hypothetical protein